MIFVVYFVVILKVNFYQFFCFLFFNLEVNNTQGARGHTEYGIFVRQAQRAKKKRCRCRNAIF